jgi:sarcosine oxidase
MRTNHHDVIVAGLGAMGGATAYHLARRGIRVLGLDRFAPPHALGSSHGRTRVIRQAYFEHPAYVPLVQRAFTLWRELEAETGRALLRLTGAVMLGGPESEAVRGTLRSAVEHRLPHERLSADEVRRRFPAFRPDAEMVGVWEPAAGALAVEAGVRAHLEAARAAGAELRFGEPVLEWRAKGGGVEVVTERGLHSAGSLVLAAGAWMRELVDWLPLQIERQVQCWFRPAGDGALLRPGRCPVFLWELPNGMVFYGLPDFGEGVKAACPPDCGPA